MFDDDHPAWEKHSGQDWHRGPEWQPENTALAEAFYSSIPPSTRLLLDVLIDRPGEQVSADELARHLRPRKPGETVTGHRRAVASNIRPMRGPAAELDRRFPFYWWKGASGSPARYGMKPFVARLFRDARNKTATGPDPTAAAGQVKEMDARALLESLAGRQILTITGQPNTVLAVAGQHVLVATERSPAGQPVPIESVQSGLDRLRETGEVEISTASLGHRSSFIGAVLRTLPNAFLVPVTPPQIRLTDPATAYRLSEAGPINTWWAGDPQQRFWLEITGRLDIGVDLHCPQRDATGSRTPGYSLIWSVEPGDVVFHYSLPERAIVAWSRAAGQVTESPTVWLSHRGATRRRLQGERAQPGWWLDLDGPFPLDPPLALAQIRDRTDDIRTVLDKLKAAHTGSLYFPFIFWGGRELRPMQPYLNKLPAELVGKFSPLTAAAATASLALPSAPGSAAPRIGMTYREAQVSPMPNGRRPFTVDPALVERGLKGHADTQNELAAVLREAGIEPRSRLPQEPNFDLAWEAGGTTFVAEVKSITDDNEEEQLRLGLGQVLRYRHRLSKLGHQRVVALLVPERTPRDRSWHDLCHELGVTLLSRAMLSRAPHLHNQL